MPRLFRSILPFILFVAATGSTLFAAPSHKGSAKPAKRVRTLATELARLRGEVETLSAKVEAKKTEIKSRVRSLARQKAELEMLVRREYVRIGQLKKRIEEHKAKVAAKAEEQKKLKPIIEKALETLRATIQGGLPFKRLARKKELKRISERLRQNMLTPSAAVAELWARVEDELRLAKENGLYSQIINLNGSEQLVDVARVGMVLLYFRTRKGKYGMAAKRDGRWTFRLLKGRRNWSPAARLFDSFKKQIRTGFFTLPNGLPGTVKGGKP
jgi:hypothetical protein